jgi:hypothetical protein
MQVDPDRLEPALIEELENSTGIRGKTIVAFSLLQNETGNKPASRPLS